jgi:hypothetical protein
VRYFASLAARARSAPTRSLTSVPMTTTPERVPSASASGA